MSMEVSNESKVEKTLFRLPTRIRCMKKLVKKSLIMISL